MTQTLEERATALRLLWDGQDPKGLAEVIVEALGNAKADSLAHQIQDRLNIVVLYEVDPAWILEGIEVSGDGEEVYVGTQQRLVDAVLSIECPDQFSEAMWITRDEILDELREEKLLVKRT